MTKLQIIILSIGIFFLFILISILFIVLLKIKKHTEMKKTIKKTSEYIRPEILKEIEIMFQRLSIIANVNKDFVRLYEELSRDFDLIEKKNKLLTKEIQEIRLKSKMINFKEFNIHINQIKVINKEFTSKVAKFKTKASLLLKAEEFLRNEMSFCRNKLRVIVSVYSKKRILLDKISHKIDKLNYVIKQLTKKFDKKIEEGKNEEASYIIEDIREKIIEFGIIINEGPRIQSTIFGLIPKIVKQLIDLYKKTETELNVDLSYLDFRNIMIKLSKIFNNIKKKYKTLQIVETKKEILFFIKNIKAIENMINSEIKSRNLFVKNYDIAISVVKQTLKQYIILKKEIKLLFSSEKKGIIDIFELFSQIKIDVNDLDENVLSFSMLPKDNSIPFTSKVARLRILLNKNNTIILAMNHLYKEIWKDDIAQKTIKNKLIQSEQAVLHLRAQIIEKSIILSDEEQKHLQDVEYTKNQLKKIFMLKPFNPLEAKETADNLIYKVASCYKMVGGKIEMAQMTSNLIKEFSHKRAINKKLNIEFIQAEKKYLQGNYAVSLNIIINSITDEKRRKK